MKFKYTATFSWGVKTRTSPRTYTHAWTVVATDNVPKWWRSPIGGAGFASSEALARKAAESFLSALRRWQSPPVAHAEIVPVEVRS